VLGYLIATVFLATYLGKLDQLFFWPYAVAAVVVFGLRVGVWLKGLRDKGSGVEA